MVIILFILSNAIQVLMHLFVYKTAQHILLPKKQCPQSDLIPGPLYLATTLPTELKKTSPLGHQIFWR
jgi:hypothetical protein